MLNVEEVTNLMNDDKVAGSGDVKEAEILVSIIDKVGLHLFMKEVWSSGGATEKALLIVMFLLRFENGFRRKCPIELSDYG